MFKRFFFGFVAAVALAAALAPATLFAHESREVGNYRLVVGFLNEPAFEGQVNAATIRISDISGAEPAPVTGAAETLQVEVTHVATNTPPKVMGLRAVFGQDGLYAADFVPTAPGTYSFRFFGTIGGTEINQTFTSGPNTFSDIEASRDIQFPVQLAETRELQSAVQGVQEDVAQAADTADSADSRASTAMLIGIIGLVVGIAGLGVGGYAVIAASRKK